MKILKEYWSVILVIILALMAAKFLFLPGYFPMHDDMQVIRLVEMDKCFRDGQIPCRWVPDLGYGYGYPLYNYYGPFPYFLMEIFHFSGLSLLASIKTEMILTIVFSGLGMFLLGRSLWGKWGGVVSSIFYIYAPYRAVDIYVRGAVGEFNALIFLPLIFWSILEFVRTQKGKYLILLALSFSGLWLSHNITSLIFAPFVVLWCLFLCWHYNKKWQSLKGLAGSFLLAFFLSGFFLLPVLLEKRLVHVESMLSGYFNYLAHFVSLKQLFLSTHWGYGPSEFGPDDDISFSIGIFHWLFALVAVVIGFILRKRNNFAFLVLAFLGLAGIFSAFMTHQRSVYIWNMVPILAYLQFPWRFLALVIFFFSLMGGAIVSFSQRRTIPITLLMMLMVILVNVNYFSPETWLKITDKDKTSGKLWEKQVTASIFDYLPIYAKAPPGDASPDKPWGLNGEVKVLDYQKGTNWQKGKIEVVTEVASIRLPLFYFPNFVLKVDNQKSKIDYQNDLGLITFKAPKGVREFNVKLEDTWARKIGNSLTILGLLFIPFYLIYDKKTHRLSEK